jgi:peptidoglycan hydrolase-like protein with peptidoglycan-binding domain
MDNIAIADVESSKLKLGSQGQEVLFLQIRLRALNFFTEEQNTTYFGEKTQEAVIAFQKANGLTADGVVGGTTQTKIEEKIRALNTNTESKAH